MKKIVSILLIAALLAQSTSQLWITVAFNLNRDYIAANLCINRFDAMPLCKGSCFLEEQLNKDQQQQQKLPDLKAKEINLFYQDNSIGLYKHPAIADDFCFFPELTTSFITSEYLRSVFRPPSSLV